jgi:ribosome-associated translation inhibitor RaiA/cold shock CspA family protein
MQVPLEIAFHNSRGYDGAEQDIRERLSKLEKLYDRLTACRVRVDQRADNSPPVVRIEISVPGGSDVVVSHEPDHLMKRFQKPDLQNAIHEAFRIAEIQLTKIKERRQRRTKEAYHDIENQYLGQVAEIDPDKDFGFLVTKEGGLLYFHRNSVLSGNFDSLKPGDELFYVEDVGDTGPLATKVRIRPN